MMRFDFLHDPLPDFVRRAASARLPSALYPATIACAAVLCAIALAMAFDAMRERAAQGVEARAATRLDESRHALEREKLQGDRLDALVESDRRLRAIKLSGSLAAQRIARTGNAFPSTASVLSMTTQSSGYLIKGEADDLAAIELLLADVVKDGAIGEPRALRITRSDTGVSPRLAFEVLLHGGR